MTAKPDHTTRRIAMYRDAMNGTVVFLEKPVYGYYRVSSIEEMTFTLLDRDMRLQAENDVLKAKSKVMKEQIDALQKHLGHTGEEADDK